MRLFVASIIASVVVTPAFAGSGQGTVLYSNALRDAVIGPQGLPLRDGNFSDAMASQGQYLRSTAFGQSFRIISDDAARTPTTLTGLRLWGASEYVELPTGQLPQNQTALSSNVVALQVAIYRVDKSQTYFPLVQQWIIDMGQITTSLTGSYVPNILSPVFQLDLQLTGSQNYTAGDYMITVGGVLAQDEGSGFAWADGVRDGSSGGADNRAFVTNGEVSSQWGVWQQVDADASGAIEIYGIPAPGAIAAVLVAGLRGNRRRRA